MVKRAGQRKEVELDQSSRLPLHEGDALIRLDITNGSRAPVDLTILFVDSRFGITTLFPTRGRTNRIAAGSHIDNIGGKITRDTVGLEGMIVIASKAASGTPVADFSFLAQKKLSRRKNVRTVLKRFGASRFARGALKSCKPPLARRPEGSVKQHRKKAHLKSVFLALAGGGF